jgi:hypothetical protein
MSTEHKKELTAEDDVKNVMKQIKAIESKTLAQPDGDGSSLTDQATSPSPVSPTDLTSGVMEAPPSVASSPLAAPPIPQAQPTPPWLHNVVEVISKESRHYGVLFRLGDIKGGKAHGYILKEQGGREYITVGADQIQTMGKAKIKAGRCCSGQWIEEHREVK